MRPRQLCPDLGREVLLWRKKNGGLFVQWNIRGFYANFEELCLLTKKYKPVVISLQET